MLKINNVTKIYNKTIALDKINFQIGSGKIVGLLGPNGSGKTTLLKIIAGVLQVDEGEVKICDIPVGYKTKALVSYLPDRTYLKPSCMIGEAFEFFKDFYQDFDVERAENMLLAIGIEKDKKFKELSKGMKEKVQLILVMSRQAKLYLLDEPIGGVDPATRDFVLNTVLKNIPSDATVIVSTHLISDIENILDEYVFISHGHIVESGSVKERKEQTGKTIDELFREGFRCY